MAAIVSPNYAFCLQHFILGWSDFHFLRFFENENIAIDWLYFYVFNFKNTANFAACAVRTGRTRGKIFIFKKSQGP